MIQIGGEGKDEFINEKLLGKPLKYLNKFIDRVAYNASLNIV